MRISKLLTLLLALLMVLSAFAGCNETAKPSESETESGTESSNGSETSKTDGSESDSQNETAEEDDILTGVSYSGVVLKVLVSNDCEVREFIEELTEGATLLDQATFNRCDYAESRLQLKTKWVSCGELGGGSSGIVDLADRENSNGGTFDIIANKSSYSAPLMTRGVLSNLLKYPHFDFEEEGWAKTLIDDVAVGNKLYVTTGDISVNLLFMTSVVYFNKDLVKDLSINQKIQSEWECENLYELVTEGKWTLDKMITLCENVYKDQNNNGKKDSGDRFGFNTYNTLLENFYYGGGYTTIVTTDDGFEASPDYLDPTMMGALLDKVNTFLHDGKDGIIEGGNGYDPTRTNFAAGNVLFCMAPASHAYNTHSNTDNLNYSVLPVPKHSESQSRYACTQSFPYMMYSIMSQAHNGNPASAFMQALAMESYEVTRPTIFDKMMKGRYAEDPEDATMWEYAIDANAFDVGRIFQDMFKESSTETLMTVNLIRTKIKEDNSNWTNVLLTYAGPLATAATNVASKIMALPD